ncbi:MAG TPA: DUF2306 domain-containing protein [Cytophagaceae bacterium]|jgi:uncharacterized membrane protein
MYFFKFLLYIHVIGGGFALLLGTIILAKNKGEPAHRLLGKIYCYAMLASALVSLPMSHIRSSSFLFVIGIFTSYMLISGKRALSLRSTGLNKKFDWGITIIMAIACLYFAGFGAFLIFRSINFGFVSIVFGLVGLLFVKQDILNYLGKSKVKNYRLVTHLQRMIGSYIASLTAFVVVNNKIVPPILGWLLPSILLVPLIVIWSRNYKLKL